LRIFKTKWFARFARQQRINKTLIEAVRRAERGLIDAILGSGVIKQRIARPGEGKSGGFRSIVLFRSGERAFFVYGFAKSAQDNIGPKELKAFKALADEVFKYDAISLLKATNYGELIEVTDDDENSK
jgi:hypothetical protein